MARESLRRTFLISALLLVLPGTAGSALISAWYGDDDGFGVGIRSGIMNPVSSNATATDAPGTDVRRAGGNPAFPAFQPTGGFSYAIDIAARITAATLIMRLGAFTPTPPAGTANSLILDGVDFSSFIGTFTANASGGFLVETRSLDLPSSFFPSLLDGAVSLSGTRLAEVVNRGSFQVDFLRLDIVTAAATPVSEPPALALLGAGLLGLGLVARRDRREQKLARATA